MLQEGMKWGERNMPASFDDIQHTPRRMEKELVKKAFKMSRILLTFAEQELIFKINLYFLMQISYL